MSAANAETPNTVADQAATAGQQITVVNAVPPDSETAVVVVDSYSELSVVADAVSEQFAAVSCGTLRNSQGLQDTCWDSLNIALNYNSPDWG